MEEDGGGLESLPLMFVAYLMCYLRQIVKRVILSRCVKIFVSLLKLILFR